MQLFSHAGLNLTALLIPTLHLSAADSVIAPGAKLEKFCDGFSFTEGPAVDKSGNDFFTDQPNDRIVKSEAETPQCSDWLKPAGRSNGTYFDKDGNLITCADEKNELWSISPDKRRKGGYEMLFGGVVVYY